MLAVTTCSQWGTELLVGALPNSLVCPTKHRRQGLTAPDGATDGLPAKALKETPEWAVDTLE